MENQIQPTQLAEIDLFSELSAESLAKVAQYSRVRGFEAGELLFRQGDPRHALYAILEGEVELVDLEHPKATVYVVLGEGRALGERALIEDASERHTLTARGLKAGVVAQLSQQEIKRLEEEEPVVYMKLVVAMTRLLSRRLRNASRGDRGRGAAFRSGKTRTEHDLLGEREVPEDVLWGIQTLRAKENFSISGIRLDLYPEWIEALAAIKQACAVVNAELGLLDEDISKAIVEACMELRKGMWHGHFVVDMIQGGAGTSTNMNANEVIANRALELLGKERGEYGVLHPNNHVNMSQSTNDVYPSSLKLALLMMLDSFLEEIERLSLAFQQKGKEFQHVIKMGRTQLQDAVPMSLGQEFNAWGLNLREGKHRIALVMDTLKQMNMGGTAIGTGINTDPRYSKMVVEQLSQLSGFDLCLAEDLVEETQDTSGFVEMAGVLKMFAVRLSKICNDLRLLSSGPRCGLGEINLPPMQPGSSIMPGKVNPVIPEVVNQVAFLIIGLDTAVALAAESGQLELNVFEPLIGFCLFSSLRMMHSAVRTLRKRCITGITANEDHIQKMVHNSIGIVTALNPYLGYERTSLVAKEALLTGKPVRDLVLEKGFLTAEEVDRYLSPEAMIRPTLKAGGPSKSS